MRVSAEVLGFAALALVVHLAAFAAVAPDGTAAGGDGGAGEVTVAAPLGAADPELAALVQAWDAPVTVAAPTAPVAAPSRGTPPETMPELARAALPALPGMAMTPPKAQTAPRIAAPALPKLFEQPQSPPDVRPRVRPDPKAKAAPRAQPTRRAAPAPSNARSAAPSQRAAGQGASGQRGQGAAQVQSGGANSASALAEWGGRIRAAVQRAQSRPRTNARGVVRLRLAVTASGQLAGVSITGSSGNAALDQAAVGAVQRARLPRAPNGVSGTHRFNLPVGFR